MVNPTACKRLFSFGCVANTGVCAPADGSGVLTRAEAEHLGTSLLGPTIEQSPHALALALARLPSDDEGNVLQEEFGGHTTAS